MIRRRRGGGRSEPEPVPVPVPVQLSRRSSRGDGHGTDGADAFGVGCFAPMVMLYFAPDGDVRACCRNWRALGNVAHDPLLEIWNGGRHLDLVDRLAHDDYSLGCRRCHDEVVVEGRVGSYPELFDSFASQLRPGAGPTWPLRMEFNLSNACNLQCIQCDGLLSSSIRIHRERRAPLPKVYGDRFFEDLRHFVPHLVEAQFAGGEPFLGAENYKVWDLIAELNPTLPCVSVTNATQWNDRVQGVLERLRMGFIFSIDGIDKATYESIRIDADFDAVMRNIGRYSDAARAHEMPLEVNHCLMVQNYAGFGDLLAWADDLGMQANVSVVRTPSHCSLAALDDRDLREVLRTMDAQSDAMLSRLTRNAPTWIAELERIRSWAGSTTDERVSLWWDPQYSADRTDNTAQILMFDRVGTSSVEPSAVLADLSASAGSSPLFEVEVGNGDVIVSVSQSVLDEFGVEWEALDGASVEVVQGLLQERYGDDVELDMAIDGPDHVTVITRFRDVSFRAEMVPVRDESGWADTAILAFVRNDLVGRSLDV